LEKQGVQGVEETIYSWEKESGMNAVLGIIRKVQKGEKGFTLIELLVVIIIIAILAAIAIPIFLGQRQKAQDAAAKSLVRNAMTSIESSFVDNQTYAPGTMTAAVLHAIEPSITFVPVVGAATAAPAIAAGVVDLASANKVDYDGAVSSYSVACVSASGNKFGVYANKAGAGNTFVKSIGGTVTKGW
jgi:prepilin-type N-terminal cleavage/methylation domain-containing protein